MTDAASETARMRIAWAVGPGSPSLRALPAIPVVPSPVEVHQRVHVGIDVSEVVANVATIANDATTGNVPNHGVAMSCKART